MQTLNYYLMYLYQREPLRANLPRASTDISPALRHGSSMAAAAAVLSPASKLLSMASFGTPDDDPLLAAPHGLRSAVDASRARLPFTDTCRSSPDLKADAALIGEYADEEPPRERGRVLTR